MKLLLLGSNGYMGQKFMSYLQDDHTIETLGHEKVSVQNLLNLFTAAAANGAPFDAIINSAGYVGRPTVDAV